MRTHVNDSYSNDRTGASTEYIDINQNLDNVLSFYVGMRKINLNQIISKWGLWNFWLVFNVLEIDHMSMRREILTASLNEAARLCGQSLKIKHMSVESAFVQRKIVSIIRDEANEAKIQDDAASFRLTKAEMDAFLANSVNIPFESARFSAKCMRECLRAVEHHLGKFEKLKYAKWQKRMILKLFANSNIRRT